MWNSRRKGVVLATTLSVAALFGAAPAAAESDIGSIAPQPAGPALAKSALAQAKKQTANKTERKKAERADKTPVIPPGPLQIVVSIDAQRVKLYANGQEVAQAPISTGTPGHPTPMGVFSIIQKNRHHVSNLYDASMPYMQRITWSGSAMHQGPLPGYPASHGCIRLPGDFAAMLWKATKLGTRVVIAREDAKPVEIEHPTLFVPKPRSVALTPRPRPLIKTADGSATVPGAVGQDTARPIDTLGAAITPTAEPAKVDDTPARNALAPETTASASEAKPTPEVAVPVAPPVPPKPVAKPSVDEQAILAEAAPSARDVQRRTSPVSVFVSRKDGRLYVRQAMEPLFDAPVTIQNPDQPIGTHVFTAIEIKNDAMRWNAISVPSAYPRPVNASAKSKKPKSTAAAQPVVEPPPSASAALDRLELTQEIRDQIGAMLTPGSSLILSDSGIASGETGQYTDFIVLTR